MVDIGGWNLGAFTQTELGEEESVQLGEVPSLRIIILSRGIYLPCLHNKNLCFLLVRNNSNYHPNLIIKKGTYRKFLKFQIRLLTWNTIIFQKLIMLIILNRWELCQVHQLLPKEGSQFRHRKYYVKVVLLILR